MSRLVCFNKPFGVLSQFTPADGHPGLASYLPLAGIYAAGRLDRDSEGLLVLTDDGDWQHRISQPDAKQPKVYWAQVENVVTEEALEHLRTGVVLRDGKTRPAAARVIPQPALWPRVPPIRHRQQIPTSWLEITLTEGRNRQIRRMTAAVGHPTLRLIRVQVGPWKLGVLQPGEYRIEQLSTMESYPAATRRQRPPHAR
ncbi:MAG: pseudouridine synthase [Porticoccaceae bacterium]